MRICSRVQSASFYASTTSSAERIKQQKYRAKFAKRTQVTMPSSAVSEAPVSNTEKQILRLPVEELTQEAFKDFGQVKLEYFPFIRSLAY